MDEPITPPEEDIPAGADQALPADPPADEAASTPDEPTTDTGADQEDALPEVDDKLKSFAKGQGIEDVAKLSKREQSLLKIAYDNQAEFQRSRQKASELEKSLKQDLATATENGDGDAIADLTGKVAELTMTQNVNAFFNEGTPEEVAEKKALEPVMAKMVTDDPQLGVLVKQNLIGFDQLFAMAKGSDAGRDAKLKQDGGREALQKVADKQSAKAVAGSATTSDMAPADDEDPFLTGFNRNSS